MKPPIVTQTPKLMQRLQWVFNPLQLLKNSAVAYGECFSLTLTNVEPIVLFSHPQAIQEIFTAPLDHLDIRGSHEILQPLVGENSLLLLKGMAHRRQRKLLTPPFHGERMKVYGQTIVDITRKVGDNLPIGSAFSLRDSLQEISITVILQAVFGLSEGDRLTQLQRLLTTQLGASSSALRAVMTFFPILRVNLGKWSPWGKFLLQKSQIDQLLSAEIQERRSHAHPTGNDILSLMISARDENGEGMTDVELRDELITLLVAGHETTATALTWALYWIHHLPSVRDRLLTELNQIKDPTDWNEISRLPYLTAVCQETLRLYPILILTIPRIVKSPLDIMGYQLEPGTVLAPCIYLVHHRPDLYPEPEKFQPERFLERQYSQYEYLPFGGGNRICIGMAFAMFEMKLVLATLLSRAKFKLTVNQPFKPVRRGITLAPPSGNWLTRVL